DPAPGAQPGFGPSAAAAAQLPGLRAIELAATGSAERLRDRALRSCEPVIEVESPRKVVEALRAFLGDPKNAPAAPTPAVQVRFATPAEFLDVYKRDLVGGTLFVPHEGEKPPIGGTVRLDLHVPSDASPVKLMGRVLHHGDVAGPGFGARVAISDVAARRLEAAVVRLRAGGKPPEIRHETRVPTRLAASIDTGVGVGHALIQDISRGGVFVATENLPPVGTGVELRIDLPGIRDGVQVAAEVVRVVEATGVGDEQPGVGLAFQDLSPEVRELIEAFVESVEVAPKARVLVVDDAALFRRLLGDELAARGCEVVEASNGAEAFDKLVDELFGLDLLVLDLVLPNTSGVELLDRIRRLGGETDLAIAVVAASGDDPVVVRRVMSAGANEVLPKSVPVKEIADRLVALLPKR
ncbi:MAG TPA: PilZ domain-containing protein, partial [Vulgatibacter sp.]